MKRQTTTHLHPPGTFTLLLSNRRSNLLIAVLLLLGVSACLDNYIPTSEKQLPWDIRLIGWWEHTVSPPLTPCRLSTYGYDYDTLITDPTQFVQSIEVLVFHPKEPEVKGRARPLDIYLQCTHTGENLPARALIRASWVWKDSLSDQPEFYIVPLPPKEFSEDYLNRNFVLSLVWWRTGLTSYFTGYQGYLYVPVLTARITQLTRNMINQPDTGTLILTIQNQELHFVLQPSTP